MLTKIYVAAALAIAAVGGYSAGTLTNTCSHEKCDLLQPSLPGR